MMALSGTFHTCDTFVMLIFSFFFNMTLSAVCKTGQSGVSL